MFKKIINDSLTGFRGVILNPTKFFQNINKCDYDLTIYSLFLTSCMITLFKSFSKKSYKNNYFTNQDINEIISFFNIPQIRWVIALLSFVLFIFLIGMVCKFFLKQYNKSNLILCLLSISIVGILLHILFFIFHYFLSQQFIYILRHIAFIWILWLSILAIKNSQDTSYMKSIMIFILSGLPPIFIIGYPGFAPYSLWLVISLIWHEKAESTLFYSISLVMRTYSQKNYSFIRQVFTKTKLTIFNINTFFTDNKNNAEVPVNSDTAATNQI